MLIDVTPNVDLVPLNKKFLFYLLSPIIPSIFIAESVKDLDDISPDNVRRSVFGKAALVDLFNVIISKPSNDCPEKYLEKTLKHYKETARYGLNLKHQIYYYSDDLHIEGLNHRKYFYTTLDNLVEVSDNKDRIVVGCSNKIYQRLSTSNSFLVTHLELSYNGAFPKYDMTPEFHISAINKPPRKGSYNRFLNLAKSLSS